jgi:hypothetical protein
MRCWSPTAGRVALGHQLLMRLKVLGVVVLGMHRDVEAVAQQIVLLFRLDIQLRAHVLQDQAAEPGAEQVLRANLEGRGRVDHVAGLLQLLVHAAHHVVLHLAGIAGLFYPEPGEGVAVALLTRGDPLQLRRQAELAIGSHRDLVVAELRVVLGEALDQRGPDALLLDRAGFRGGQQIDGGFQGDFGLVAALARPAGLLPAAYGT